MRIDVNKLLTTAQKESVIQERLRLSGKVTGAYVLKYDGSYSWDFAVRSHQDSNGAIIPQVTISVPFSSRRLGAVLEEVAQAIEDIRSGRRTHVQRGNGPFAERNML